MINGRVLIRFFRQFLIGSKFFSMEFYLGGFYLVQPKNFQASSGECFSLLTVSSCVNGILPEFFEEGQLPQPFAGFPHVFFRLESLREFQDKFYPDLKDLKAIGIFLSEHDQPEFSIPNSSSLSRLLRQKIVYPGGSLKGYDLLGMEPDGSLHSFFCNNLDKIFGETLGITLNSHGLFSEYQDVARAYSFLKENPLLAEPAAWFPCIVKEF